MWQSCGGGDVFGLYWVANPKQAAARQRMSAGEKSQESGYSILAAVGQLPNLAGDWIDDREMPWGAARTQIMHAVDFLAAI
jgi:hypothetical protein